MIIRSGTRSLALLALIVIVSVPLALSFNHANIFAQSADVVDQSVDDAQDVDAASGPYDGIEGLKLSVSPDSVVSDGGTVELVAWVSQGTDIDWFWDFGDGQTYFSSGTGRFNDITHTYTLANSATDQVFTASVKAKNAKNQMTATIDILVKIKAPTGLTVSYSPQEPSVGQEVTFNATLDNPVGVKYTWNLGDGTVKETESSSIKHIYNDSRPYNYSVSASNRSGGTPTIGGTINVSDSGPTYCNINVNGVSQVDSPLVISASSDGSNVRYTWKFSDEQNSRGNQSVARSYATPGTYNIDLTCSNNKNSIKATRRTLNIIDPPITRLQIMNTATVEKPQKPKDGVLFSAHSDGTSISYKWEFGDGNSMTTLDSTIEHPYSEPGQYFVSVVASNSSSSLRSEATVHIMAEPVDSSNGVKITYQPANPELRDYPVAGELVVLQLERSISGQDDAENDEFWTHPRTEITWYAAGITETVVASNLGGPLAIPGENAPSIMVPFDQPGQHVVSAVIYHTTVDGVRFLYAAVEKVVRIGGEQRMPFIIR